MIGKAASLRRGACPGLYAPMETGDGLLVRLLPLSRTISLDAFAGLCRAAQRHGNGMIEVTARGSLQIRGLTQTSAPLLADEVAALGVASETTVPIHVNPLAGLDPSEISDASELAAQLQQCLSEKTSASQLSPKISVLIDGGGALHLDRLSADVRLRAETTSEGLRYLVAIGGDGSTATTIGATSPEQVVPIVLNILHELAKRGRETRGRDLLSDNAWRIALSKLLTDAPAPPLRQGGEPIGMHQIKGEKFALGVGLPFGQAACAELEEWLQTAKQAGASGLRTAPGGTLLLIGMTAYAIDMLFHAAKGRGFITSANDPRRFVAACAGAPFCKSAQAPARSLGPHVAQAATSLFDGSVTLHVSGCSKGCAHRGSPALTLIGDDGKYRIVINGSPSDQGTGWIDADALPAALTRLADKVHSERQAGETNSAVLARLGARAVSMVLSEEAAFV
jgi:precorrin-3B synthase